MRLLSATISFALLAFAGCEGEAQTSESPRVEIAWRLAVPAAAEGSLTLCDLEGDGALELIASLNSPTATDTETQVLALSVSGEVRWSGARGEHAYGAPACVQANSAGPEDVLVTGRTGDVIALDGMDGTELWRLSAQNPNVLDPAISPSFASSVALDPSRSFAATTLAGDRFASKPSRLVLFQPNGSVIATLDAPDGAESYASPAFTADAMGNVLLAFATGGETVGGHIYLLRYDPPTTLTKVAEIASACPTGGFVGSPHFADLDGDGAHDLIASDYCGVVHVSDREGRFLWEYEVGGYGTANPVSADLDGDNALDVVVATSTFNPSASLDEIPTSTVVGLRGRDGALIFQRDLPQAILASPVILDVDGDGSDDVFVIAQDFIVGDAYLFQGGLSVLSGRDGSTLVHLPGIASYGTPTGADVDGDGALDLFVEDDGNGASLFRLSFPDTVWDATNAWMGFRGSPIPTGAR